MWHRHADVVQGMGLYMVMMTKCPVCGGKIMDIHGPIEWDVKGEQIIVDDAD